jgi:hypothetical protein
MAVTDLIPGWAEAKLGLSIVLAVVILAGVGFGVYKGYSLYEHYQQLEADNAQLVINNATLKSNVTTLEGANATDAQTIEGLKADHAAAEKVVGELAKQAEQNRQALAATQATLDKLAKDPKNNGVVAPDLRETIRSIQGASK